MATIHLMVGFIGFGKTTLAKLLETQLSAIRLTHDDIMTERYGRHPDDFDAKYKQVDDFIKNKAATYIKQGKDIIMDYGLWTHKRRKDYYQWAKTLTDNVVFHPLDCDINEAKQRVLKRTKNNKQALYIDENIFDALLKQYEPWDDKDNYPLVLHNLPTARYIGQLVNVKIDRPKQSKHPKFGFEYPVNYGFVPYTKSGDGEELDVYVLGVDKPLDTYTGRCIGVVHRINDNDDKLIVVPQNLNLTDNFIEEQIAFQEKWFKHILIRYPYITKTHFGVYGTAIKDNKILLIKKARGPYTGLYDLPGGSQEQNETYLETLEREIMEETGCKLLKAENERFKSVIFSDFTPQSEEKGILHHNAVLYDVELTGFAHTTRDGLDSNGAVWVDVQTLNSENATPYALIGAKKPLIAVSNKNSEIISTHLRGLPLKANTYPTIASVLLFNSRKNIILQKIAAHKKWGGLWSYSAAGHVDAGENPQQAAERELKEEMGINAAMEYQVCTFPVLRNGKLIAFHHVFIAHSDETITPDQNEVDDVKEISLPDLKNDISNHPELFLDAFLTAVTKYLEKTNV